MVFLLESMPVGRVFGAEIHRVFGIDQQTFMGVAFVLINLAILAFVLAKFLYNPVRQMLHDRTERIANSLKNAEDENTAASGLKAQYEAKLKNIEIERDEILDSARKLAAEKSKQLLDEAKTEAEAIRKRAMHTIELEQERVKDEMRQSIIEISSVMAQKFVSRTMDSDTQDMLFAEAMAEIEGSDFNKADAEDRVIAGK